MGEEMGAQALCAGLAQLQGAQRVLQNPKMQNMVICVGGVPLSAPSVAAGGSGPFIKAISPSGQAQHSWHASAHDPPLLLLGNQCSQ